MDFGFMSREQKLSDTRNFTMHITLKQNDSITHFTYVDEQKVVSENIRHQKRKMKGIVPLTAARHISLGPLPST